MKKIPTRKEVQLLFQKLQNRRLTASSLTPLELIILHYTPEQALRVLFFRYRLKAALNEGRRKLASGKKLSAFTHKYFYGADKEVARHVLIKAVEDWNNAESTLDF